MRYLIIILFLLQGCATLLYPDNTLVVDGKAYYNSTPKAFKEVKQGRRGFWLRNKEALSDDEKEE